MLPYFGHIICNMYNRLYVKGPDSVYNIACWFHTNRSHVTIIIYTDFLLIIEYVLDF